MAVLERPWGRMHYQAEGEGPTVVLAGSLGTDLRLWDPLLPHLPPGLRVLRYDKRGHGLSDRGGPFAVEDLAEDAAALIAAEARGPVAFVGLSIGGLTGQALAARRPGLLRALVLSNTGARIGTPALWEARVAAALGPGLESIAEEAMERWFSPGFRASAAVAPWRNMLARADPRGYADACRAIAAADLAALGPALALPCLAIAGGLDGATPPAVVEDMARRIPGAGLVVLDGLGHVPPVEDPAAYAAVLAPFLMEHLRA